MKKLSLVIILATVLLSACVSSQQLYAEDYAQAHKAFVEHDYVVAFDKIQAPARAGNPDAQYALGYMYYYGKGTLVNEDLARYWFEHAAAQGQPAARKALARLRE